ncbi:SIS domain-containing protein [Mycobacterium antarcticum]|uniref:SIS domain-containing protein n=1 Tax=Mycolicibacterium sp. TUM20984 TaxID=3023368 RepID=UPI0023A31B5B|nr:SIS domain-containing protein [Mycolicibacterium sp. TUM20984]GLP79999.1 hypothetical protein TUM20984_14190 [Mycolicibacterium sp. TUM20984]
MTDPRADSRSPYEHDIHAQPDVLQQLLDSGLGAEGRHVLGLATSVDRIVLTGMGASLHGMYPSYLRLLDAGLPVWLVETAELLGPAGGLVTPTTLLWITSQSGHTAEVIALLSEARVRPAAILGVTNSDDSPLALGCDAVLSLRSGTEMTVGTRSYTNTLAVTALAADAILGAGSSERALRLVPQALSDYLHRWDEHVARLETDVLRDTALFALGRSSSLAAAATGALIVKEAAAHPIEPLSAPQFRHGPLEMAGPAITTLILAGDGYSRPLNARLDDDLRSFGANTVWLDPREESHGPPLPHLTDDVTRPFAEILPFQALSVALARRASRVPGNFSKIGKVTTTL